MTDLLNILPHFPTQKYVRLLPPLEKNLVTVADLLTLDCVEIAKRATLPLLDVKRLCADVLAHLRGDLGIGEVEDEDEGPKEEEKNTHGKGLGKRLRRSGKDVVNAWETISTLDDDMDRALGGGIPTGYITEVTGERCVSYNFLLFHFHSNSQSPFVGTVSTNTKLQRRGQNAIPHQSPTLRTTSRTSWPLGCNSLHIYRIPSSYNPVIPAPTHPSSLHRSPITTYS